tara:strand:- start:2323 stop:3120 length:798 start_codon:yes stop_codon:yes gene_type:complete
MYIHDLNPILINLGFFEVRWYSLAYIFGILLGWWYGKKIIKFKSKNDSLNENTQHFDDLVAYIIISIILGGRLGYVIFYNLDYYLSNPLKIFQIWEGGMSFHGALLGIIVGVILFTRKRNIKTLFFLDIIACVAPIGIFFGRIANFINSELYGYPSEILWSVIFPKVDDLSRHPSQIYEALLEGVLLFIILNSLNFRKKIKDGWCSSLFLIFYGLFRVVSETFREPDEQIGLIFNLFSMGTVLSILMILTGFFLLIKIKKYESDR